MKIFQWLFGLIFGNNPLQTVADALTKAHSDSLNAKTVSEKTAADERVATLTLALADVAKARDASKTMPWWLAFPMGSVAFFGALHVCAVFAGSTFAPMLDRTSGLGAWLLNIPAPPGDYAKYEAEIIVFFFGGAVILAGVKAVTGAFGKK